MEDTQQLRLPDCIVQSAGSPIAPTLTRALTPALAQTSVVTPVNAQPYTPINGVTPTWRGQLCPGAPVKVRQHYFTQPSATSPTSPLVGQKLDFAMESTGDTQQPLLPDCILQNAGSPTLTRALTPVATVAVAASPMHQPVVTPSNVKMTTWRQHVCPNAPKQRRYFINSDSTPSSTPAGLKTPINFWPSPEGTPITSPISPPMSPALFRATSLNLPATIEEGAQAQVAGYHGVTNAAFPAVLAESAHTAVASAAPSSPVSLSGSPKTILLAEALPVGFHLTPQKTSTLMTHAIRETPEKSSVPVLQRAASVDAKALMGFSVTPQKTFAPMQSADRATPEKFSSTAVAPVLQRVQSDKLSPPVLQRAHTAQPITLH